MACCIVLHFFFSSRRRHTRFDCDWSSDVCSSDLDLATRAAPIARRTAQAARAAEGDLDAADWYELGVELEAVEPGEARDAYRRALELDAHHADAHVNLGRLLHEQGMIEEAERHYRLALRESPDHTTAAFNLGIA